MVNLHCISRLFYIILLFSCSFSTANAQFFTEVDWQKLKIPALQVSIPYSQSVTEDAIKLQLGQMGFSPSQEKGGMVFKSVRLPEIGPDVYDLIFKVQKKGRKDSESCDVYLVVSRGNNNYVRPSDTDSLPASMRKYSSRFSFWAEAQALEEDIKSQEDKVKTSQRRLQTLIDDGVLLEKKLQRLQQEIQDNKQAQEKQKADVDIQGKTLEALLKKRKQ